MFGKKIIPLLLAALVEKTAFRVLLPKLFSEQMHFSTKISVVVSSIVFALFHGINLLSGLVYPFVLLQVLYAFCAGCAVCALVQRTKSVIPSVILHLLINWTAGNQVTDTILLISTIAFSVLLAGYAMTIFHKTQRGTIYL